MENSDSTQANGICVWRARKKNKILNLNYLQSCWPIKQVRSHMLAQFTNKKLCCFILLHMHFLLDSSWYCLWRIFFFTFLGKILKAWKSSLLFTYICLVVFLFSFFSLIIAKLFKEKHFSTLASAWRKNAPKSDSCCRWSHKTNLV